jgi:polyphosphate kinase
MSVYQNEETSIHPLEDASSHINADSPYFNRELSWLSFNQRVLEEAFDERNPLLERIKFVAIFASNLDEFFMIRVSGLKQQIAAGVQKLSPDGLTPSEQFVAIHRVLVPILEQKRHLLLDELVPKLAEEGIYILNYDQLNPSQCETVRDYFEQRIFPVLTPLAIDPSHPFPHISNLSLNLAVVLCEHGNGQSDNELFARVKVPEVLPRLVPLPRELAETSDDEQPAERRYYFVWIEQIIAAHLSALFPGMEVKEVYPFRIIRNADMEIEEDEADDLLRTIEQGVRQRRFGEAVRMTIDETMTDRVRDLLMNNLKLKAEDVYTMRGPLALGNLMSLMKLDRPDLKDAPIYPGVPITLRGQMDLFEAIRQQDIVLHHPYDSFAPVIDFIETAAKDPDVLAIKQTLYRVGSNSPIVQALMHAREQNKQVTVLVELKARFDEENNIIWARALERAGVHVVYGLLGLKTHAKLALVVRREGDGIERYVHLGTGNYNAGTARLYTDLGMLTCRPDIGADVSELFNSLTGYSRQREYRKLFVAPVTLRQQVLELIKAEIASHEQHGNGHLIFKMNSLIDPRTIDALYEASQAGVRVDLIVRGMCCLRPGIPGRSENIHVRSIVGKFLEHNRIFYFHGGGVEHLYMGSADLMQRNLDRRIETLFPVEEEALRRFIRDQLLQTYLDDNIHARVLHPDGHYTRLSPGADEQIIDSQDISMGYHAYTVAALEHGAGQVSSVG